MTVNVLSLNHGAMGWSAVVYKFGISCSYSLTLLLGAHYCNNIKTRCFVSASKQEIVTLNTDDKIKIMITLRVSSSSGTG